ncbi:MAG: serine protease, partial [Anaerolineaceae bacterium]
LVSPISVMLALSMTANGADGDTLAQMEKVLGKDIPIDELNEYLYYYANNLPNEEKSKQLIANSIWFRDDEDRLVIEKDFLQTNANYYNAEIYKSPFTDQTLKDINNWVNINTDGMIDKIIDQIDDDTIMYLINAIVFDAEWKVIYTKGDIYQGEFTAIDGSKQISEFMVSGESLYLDDGSATGFIKPYYNNKYSFVALLPNEGITIENYINNLSGEELLKTIRSPEMTVVNTTMPKFSYEYEIRLNDILKNMGMSDGFNPTKASFTRMGRSSRGNIYIGEVLHKTFISLDELGTKAGAVTKVEMKDESAIMDMKIVKLDRPFLYAIIDNSTKLPLFIGTLMDLKKLTYYSITYGNRQRTVYNKKYTKLYIIMI